MRLTRTLLAIALTISPAAIADAGPATGQLQTHVERLFSTLADAGLAAPDKAEQRRATVYAIAADAFDFTQSARLALGTHWDGLTPAQRSEFVELFQRFIERAYLANIELPAGTDIAWATETVERDRAVVRAKVLAKGSETGVDFRMVQTAPDVWKLYDVAFDGTSLVGNYRVQFGRVIRAGSYDELVKRLRAKQ
jgi:phospholipid transport system substrate-binding protein